MKILLIPWWVCAILAVAFYCSFKYLPPIFLTETWAEYLPRLAPLGAMGLLLYGAAMLYENDDTTTDADEFDLLENAQLDEVEPQSNQQVQQKRDEYYQE